MTWDPTWLCPRAVSGTTRRALANACVTGAVAARPATHHCSSGSRGHNTCPPHCERSPQDLVPSRRAETQGVLIRSQFTGVTLWRLVETRPSLLPSSSCVLAYHLPPTTYHLPPTTYHLPLPLLPSSSRVLGHVDHRGAPRFQVERQSVTLPRAPGRGRPSYCRAVLKDVRSSGGT